MARSDLSAADGVVDQVQESSVDLDPPPRPLLLARRGVHSPVDASSILMPAEEGWTRLKKEVAKHPLMERPGWCWSRECLTSTTPSARANVASRLFLIAQPPLLTAEEGSS